MEVCRINSASIDMKKASEGRRGMWMENFFHFEVAKSNFVNTPKNSSSLSSPLFAFFPTFISFLVWFTYSIKFSTWHNCRRLKVFLTPLANKWDSDGGEEFGLSEKSSWRVQQGLDSTWSCWQFERFWVKFETIPWLTSPPSTSMQRNYSSSLFRVAVQSWLWARNTFGREPWT